MAESSIEWTRFTFNPWRGCSKVHTGCKNCYAEVNYSVKMHGIKWGTQAQGGTRVKLADAGWRAPLTWNRAAEKSGERYRVFCASLADVFEDWDGPILDHNGCQLYVLDGVIGDFPHTGRDATLDDLRRDLFKLIDATPNLDWLLLTKRPENVRRMWPCKQCGGTGDAPIHWMHRPNVWLGTSVSDQATAEEWVPKLLECRDLSPVLFVSAEPLVGRIRMRVRDIDWLIVGGESGAGARRCEIEWVRSLVRQAKDSAVSVFVKQLGAFIVDRNDAGFEEGYDDPRAWPEPQDVRHHINGFREDFQGADCRVVLKDGKGGDMDEWPADLRVRQFPASAVAAAF